MKLGEEQCVNLLGVFMTTMESPLEVLSRAATMVQDNSGGMFDHQYNISYYSVHHSEPPCYIVTFHPHDHLSLCSRDDVFFIVILMLLLFLSFLKFL